jgi:RNA polymerase sigma-70 factor (ECF subfamily)
MECLSLLRAGSERPGATALEAAAELATVAGWPERAAEYYGARERVARESRVPEEPHASEARARALNYLRTQLGQDQFRTAWGGSGDTSDPEFYVCAALLWLEELEGKLPTRMDPGPYRNPAAAEAPGSTAQLIIRAQEGSHSAKDQLVARFVRPLHRFAHGRLPIHARDIMDTDDLVVVTLARGVEKVHKMEPMRKGGFFAYLRQIVVNQVRDEIRRHSRRPKSSPLHETIASPSCSPLEEMIKRETLEAYRSAVSKLPPRDQEALALRIDRGCTYQEVADAIRCPSANAARMVVSRSIESLANSLGRG